VGLTRRAFFASVAAAMVLDPERLLWRPGAKTISIPAPPTRDIAVWFEPGPGGIWMIGDTIHLRRPARFNPDANWLNPFWIVADFDVYTVVGVQSDGSARFVIPARVIA
jgi:hypothetical protein